MVKAPNLLGVHPNSISYVCTVFQHHNMMWRGIWGYPYTVMPVQVRSGFRKIGVGQCCNVMVKAPNLLGVHPKSILYIYKVFQHRDMLWMGIWVYPYTVTPVQVGSGF